MTNPRTTARRRRLVVAAAVAATVVLVTGCLPPRPSAGRATPVRRVLILGDSLTWGLYGATPGMHHAIGRRMSARGISVRLEGFPAEDPATPRAGTAPWSERVRHQVATWNPDVVVIQSMLFPKSGSAQWRALYAQAMRDIFGAAQARGAHVYRVTHHVPVAPKEAGHRWVAEVLQAEAAAGKGIEAIPLDVWIGGCRAPFWTDGWHLNGSGVECHADAITAAIDQLRGVVG